MPPSRTFSLLVLLALRCCQATQYINCVGIKDKCKDSTLNCNSSPCYVRCQGEKACEDAKVTGNAAIVLLTCEGIGACSGNFKMEPSSGPTSSWRGCCISGDDICSGNAAFNKGAEKVAGWDAGCQPAVYFEDKCPAGTAPRASAVGNGQNWKCNYNAAVTCAQGKYGTTSCTNCPPGQYTNQAGQATCKGTSCAAGTFAAAGAASVAGATCATCDDGKYQSQTGKTSCTASTCAKGKYMTSGQARTQQCSDCPQGQYQAQTGQTSCVTGTCAKGQYQSSAKDEAQQCSGCGAGTYAAQTGQTSCAPCAAGTTPSTDKTSCLPVGSSGGGSKSQVDPGSSDGGTPMCDPLPAMPGLVYDDADADDDDDGGGGGGGGGVACGAGAYMPVNSTCRPSCGRGYVPAGRREARPSEAKTAPLVVCTQAVASSSSSSSSSSSGGSSSDSSSSSSSSSSGAACTSSSSFSYSSSKSDSGTYSWCWSSPWGSSSHSWTPPWSSSSSSFSSSPSSSSSSSSSSSGSSSSSASASGSSSASSSGGSSSASSASSSGGSSSASSASSSSSSAASGKPTFRMKLPNGAAVDPDFYWGRNRSLVGACVKEEVVIPPSLGILLATTSAVVLTSAAAMPVLGLDVVAAEGGSAGAEATAAGAFGLLLGQAQFITMQAQTGVRWHADFAEFTASFRWFNLQGLSGATTSSSSSSSLSSSSSVPTTTTNSSTNGGANVAGGSGRRRRRRRRRRALLAAVPSAGEPKPPKSRNSAVGPGIRSFCDVAGIPPEDLFLTTMSGFLIFVAVVVAVHVLKMLYTRWQARRGSERHAHQADLQRWRFRGMVVKICYYGFFAVSSTAMLQIYVTVDETTTTASGGSGGGVGAGAVTLAVIMLVLLLVVVFAGSCWILRGGRASEEQAEYAIGALLLKPYKPSHRQFWVVRAVQILAASCSTVLLQHHPAAQVSILVGIHAASLVSAAVAKPFRSRFVAATALSVEVARLACALLMFASLENPDAAVEVATLIIHLLVILCLGAVELSVVVRAVLAWHRRGAPGHGSGGGGGGGGGKRVHFDRDSEDIIHKKLYGGPSSRGTKAKPSRLGRQQKQGNNNNNNNNNNNKRLQMGALQHESRMVADRSVRSVDTGTAEWTYHLDGASGRFYRHHTNSGVSEWVEDEEAETGLRANPMATSVDIGHSIDGNGN